ncbi:hypothetical protein M3N64_11700 [Sporolactobacillus sp. CPB3-1]|uniref:Uncharacterized protein n=1 Tax=Sporolactobacillus mangiferae TaxID=2940498 RepID=A0ABT0MCH4_9BACL|nr:hypothetical protein [Sporolactobacillus mangiferae]MCL1632582.1 hypothetical protein [Sporolactobacillus mangiferae]
MDILIDLIFGIFEFIFAPQNRVQSNLASLESKEWFRRNYNRKILEDPKFRRFIKKYHLKKIFQDKDREENFKRELEKWVKANQARFY